MKMKKILLIEDNQELRENTAEILELADYEVITASHGKEGVELAVSQLPDLIVCDIMMPQLGGYGVLQILTKKEATRNIPFVFLTAKTDKSDFRKGMNLGADDYLTKPFDDTELLDTVETRLSKSETAKSDYGHGLEGMDILISDAQVHRNLEDLKKERKTRKYKKKKDIFLEGDTPHFLMFVKQGKIKTYKTNEEGKELITGIYVKGDFFGYESILEGEYGESATTLEPSEMTMIPKEEFLTLIYGNHIVSRKFIEILSHKVAKKEQQLLDLAYSTVRQRTAKALLDILDKYKRSGENLELSISREDLANMVGTATETVIRVLSEFKDEHLISIEKNRILVKELDKINIVAERNFAF